MYRILAKVLLLTVMLVPAAQAGTALTINIVGKPDHAQMSADADQARRIATVLAADSRLQGLGLRVEVKRGVATVAGRVYNDQERQRALQLVRAAAGTADIENRIVALEDFMPTTLARGGDRVTAGI